MDIETRIRVKQHVTKDDIRRGLEQLGVTRGDIILFHSSLSSMGYVEGGADAVIDAFLETVGEEGTVAVPTLTGGTDPAAGEIWDRESTPSIVGLITERLRKRPESVRSNHPTCSIAAIGPHAEELIKHQDQALADSSDHPAFHTWRVRGAFVPGSSWEKLYALDAKYLLLGVDFYCCTIFHYAQDALVSECSRIHPPVPWPHFDLLRMGRELERRGLVKIGQIGEATARLTHSRETIDTVLDLLRNHYLEFAGTEDAEFVTWYKQHILPAADAPSAAHEAP